MSLKRSRASYESDASTSYAAFGTPLPAQSHQDGGAYVPLWKQEVKDDKGRKRLHGAFTGGWSAGYFNTVGSKEGWAPASFVSSRGNRRGTGGQYAPQRPEDFMDEEDLAEAEEAKKLQTTDAFAGIGIAPGNLLDRGDISDISGLFGSQDSTTGFRLLQRMGWKPGQGIGPKVQRGARLGGASGDPATVETYSFAPDDTEIAEIVQVTGNHGLGYVEGSAGRARPLLGILGAGAGAGANLDGDEEDGFGQPSRGSRAVHKGPKGRSRETTGIGVGILNDTGSDDDDPFELGPKISYNRVADSRAWKRKKNQTKPSIPAAQPLAAHGLSQPVPVYLSKRARDRGQSRSDGGKTQLGGFVLSTRTRSDSLVKHTPPPVPEGWVSAKLAAAQQVLPASVAPIKTGLGPASRGAILGEESLRGKSVFDYITSSSRDRVVAATGNKDLPPGRGDSQQPAAAAAAAALGTAGQNSATSSNSGPPLDKATALAALARSFGGGNNSPYMGQGEKQARYGVFLKFAAGLVSSGPKRPPELSAAEFGREQQEFASCANIFKPMTGLMASRFTTAASSSDPPPPPAREAPGLATPVSAEEAAKLNMHGTLTRIVKPFTPNSLLCKRCDIKVSSDRPPRPPVQPDDCQGQPDRIHGTLAYVGSAATHQQQPSSASDSSGGQKDTGAQPSGGGGDTWSDLGAAREEALRAIFGSDSDD